MSPLRFTVILIPSTFTMLELLLSAWKWTESIQPCVDYISKWPQQSERGEAGVNLWPQESTSGSGLLTIKHKPSLTHVHLLALEQKRLRRERAMAEHKSELQTHLIVQTTGEKTATREWRNETQRIYAPSTTLTENIHTFHAESPNTPKIKSRVITNKSIFYRITV